MSYQLVSFGILLWLVVERCTAHDDCFYPNGTVAKGQLPCGDPLNGAYITCCPSGWACSENQICVLEFIKGYFRDASYQRATCTDADWKDSSCPRECTRQYDSGSLTLCDLDEHEAEFCCNPKGGEPCGQFHNCGRGVFTVPALRVFTSISASRSQPSATQITQDGDPIGFTKSLSSPLSSSSTRPDNRKHKTHKHITQSTHSRPKVVSSTVLSSTAMSSTTMNSRRLTSPSKTAGGTATSHVPGAIQTGDSGHSSAHQSGEHLSAGSKAAISISTITFVAVIAGIILFLVRKRRKSHHARNSSNLSTQMLQPSPSTPQAFGNANYQYQGGHQYHNSVETTSSASWLDPNAYGPSEAFPSAVLTPPLRWSPPQQVFGSSRFFSGYSGIGSGDEPAEMVGDNFHEPRELSDRGGL